MKIAQSLRYVAEPIRRLFTRAYWRQFWKSKRKIVVRGAILGVAIHLFLLYHPTGPSSWLEDYALDLAVKYGTDLPRPSDPAFVFIDIDDATMDDWPLVPYVPRDKLLKLIQYATNSEAILVHVDVNLTRKINPSSKNELSESDRALATFLQNYSAPPQANGNDSPRRRPLLILNRELQQSLKETDACQNRRPSFLDDYVNPKSGLVRWGTVQFDEDADQKVRYWRLWERACSVDEPPSPSVQFLATSYLQRCRDTREPCVLEQPADLSLEHNHEVSERIVYGIKWNPGNWPEVMVDGKKVPVVRIIRAKDIAEADESKPLSPELLKDRIVVIGGTAEFERDMHSTPVGEMPGALIIINSIYSLNRFGRLQKVPVAVEICVAVVLIAIASVFFAMLQHFWAYLLTGFITVVALLPLSLFAFRRGYWLDFAIPLLAVETHHFFAQFEEAFESLHKGKKVEDEKEGGNA